MTQYQIEYRTPLDVPKGYTEAQEEWLRQQVAEKVTELIFEKQRTDYVCISPYKFEVQDLWSIQPEKLTRFTINVEYSRSVPIFHTFSTYKGEPIKPPNELTFWERVTFIFTGKYPVG